MHASVKVASKEYAYGSGAVMSVLRIPLVIITRNAEYIASNLKVVLGRSKACVD